jgi:hypothetical protein
VGGVLRQACADWRCGKDEFKNRARTTAAAHHRRVWSEEANMRGLSLATLMAATAWAGTAISEDDEFKQAVNYVFSGNIEGKTPQLLSSIVDEDKCIISVETPGNSWVYYMKEIKPDMTSSVCSGVTIGNRRNKKSA